MQEPATGIVCDEHDLPLLFWSQNLGVPQGPEDAASKPFAEMMAVEMHRMWPAVCILDRDRNRLAAQRGDQWRVREVRPAIQGPGLPLRHQLPHGKFLLPQVSTAQSSHSTAFHSKLYSAGAAHIWVRDVVRLEPRCLAAPVDEITVTNIEARERVAAVPLHRQDMRFCAWIGDHIDDQVRPLRRREGEPRSDARGLDRLSIDGHDPSMQAPKLQVEDPCGGCVQEAQAPPLEAPRRQALLGVSMPIQISPEVPDQNSPLWRVR